MAQRNKGPETVLKELKTARAKTAEDRKKEQALADAFKNSVSTEILKQISDVAGTEEELVQLITGLKSGEAKISIIWGKEDSGAEDMSSETDSYNLVSDDLDNDL